MSEIVTKQQIVKGQSGKIKFERLEILEIIKKQIMSYRDHSNKQMWCPCGLSRTIGWLYRCFFCGIYFCTLCAKDHFGDDGV